MAKKKTVKQQKNKYRNLEYAFTGGSYLAVFTPFIAIGIANYDKYFVQYDGAKMSVAFALALAMMGFAIWGITKKKIENTMLAFILKWVIAAFIFQMLGDIITDIATIMWFGLIGLVASYGCDEGAKKMRAKKERKIENMKKAEDKQDIEQYSEELKDE